MLPGLFVQAGLSADEVFYLNPSIRAGWHFLYGIVQLSTNFNVSGVRYGAGGSLRLSAKWELGLSATTGACSKNYPLAFLSTQYVPITVKTHLNKIGLLVQREISRKFQLQFGPVLDLLSTQYYNTVGISTPLFISESNVNSLYTYIKPPYTIRDTYSPTSARNTKVWIGSQVSLFYTLNFPGSR